MRYLEINYCSIRSSKRTTQQSNSVYPLSCKGRHSCCSVAYPGWQVKSNYGLFVINCCGFRSSNAQRGKVENSLPNVLQAKTLMLLCSLSGRAACTSNTCWKSVHFFCTDAGNSSSQWLLRAKLPHRPESSSSSCWYRLGKFAWNYNAGLG